MADAEDKKIINVLTRALNRFNHDSSAEGEFNGMQPAVWEVDYPGVGYGTLSGMPITNLLRLRAKTKELQEQGLIPEDVSYQGVVNRYEEKEAKAQAKREAAQQALMNHFMALKPSDSYKAEYNTGIGYVDNVLKHLAAGDTDKILWMLKNRGFDEEAAGEAVEALDKESLGVARGIFSNLLNEKIDPEKEVNETGAKDDTKVFNNRIHLLQKGLEEAGVAFDDRGRPYVISEGPVTEGGREAYRESFQKVVNRLRALGFSNDVIKNMITGINQHSYSGLDRKRSFENLKKGDEVRSKQLTDALNMVGEGDLNPFYNYIAPGAEYYAPVIENGGIKLKTNEKNPSRPPVLDKAYRYGYVTLPYLTENSPEVAELLAKHTDEAGNVNYEKFDKAVSDFYKGLASRMETFEDKDGRSIDYFSHDDILNYPSILEGTQSLYSTHMKPGALGGDRYGRQRDALTATGNPTEDTLMGVRNMYFPASFFNDAPDKLKKALTQYFETHNKDALSEEEKEALRDKLGEWKEGKLDTLEKFYDEAMGTGKPAYSNILGTNLRKLRQNIIRSLGRDLISTYGGNYKEDGELTSDRRQFLEGKSYIKSPEFEKDVIKHMANHILDNRLKGGVFDHFHYDSPRYKSMFKEFGKKIFPDLTKDRTPAVEVITSKMDEPDTIGAKVPEEKQVGIDEKKPMTYEEYEARRKELLGL